VSSNLTITCPCCETLLVVDPETGAILREERVLKREHQSLDDALHQVKSQRKEAEARLARAMEEARHREQILEKKFEEAKKKAALSDEPPPRPFDGD
jgi:sugar-specific transcriptional regulator TrmB